jgi:hypothetical protein
MTDLVEDPTCRQKILEVFNERNKNFSHKDHCLMINVNELFRPIQEIYLRSDMTTNYRTIWFLSNATFFDKIISK